MSSRTTKGITIAGPKYASLTDKQLERVLRGEFRRNAHLLTRDCLRPNPKYSVIEPNIHGVKITSQKTESKLKNIKDCLLYTSDAADE